MGKPDANHEHQLVFQMWLPTSASNHDDADTGMGGSGLDRAAERVAFELRLQFGQDLRVMLSTIDGKRAVKEL